LKEQTSSKTSKFFNRVATQGWHKSAYFTYSWKFPVMRRWLAAQLSLRQKRVLSVGCGSGELERDLARLGFTVVGIDISHVMLKTARRRGLRRLVEADARLLPFSSASFDAVLFPESIGYFELEDVMPEARRVLRKPGRLLITAYPPDFESDSIYKTRSLAEISRQLRGCGFRVIDQRSLTVKRNAVIEVDSEKDSELLYVMARRAPQE
jgi:ubiquinone/menaquinone biosynthesis C-methylase UbiE